MIPGFTSTGSKRAEALFGRHPGPRRMARAEGCRVWDAEGREYLDTTMALGAVALGYADPAVTAAVEAAARDGVVGPLPPVLEAKVAERLLPLVPGAEAVRFLKTGAEAVAAALRIARVATGRDAVVSCGYHGWLDWSRVDPGVPAATQTLHTPIRFNDVAGLSVLDALAPAAVVVEPVINDPPSAPWVSALRETATRSGALLVLDEIKTGIRFGPGGAAGRYGFGPDLVVLGKALGNGYPIAAVVGPRDVMAAASRTWISSTLATEYVSLAAAEVVLERCAAREVDGPILREGSRLLEGLRDLAERHPGVVTGVRGIPEFCHLTFASDDLSALVASRAAAQGLLFKRNAYNFISAAHDRSAVDRALTILGRVLDEVHAEC